ncbi:Hypothetical predicted protein [Olea europaea subsp. europaea]|uniref:Transmembrane protein n=1 Tax=Olea europaea subsp. europaea TaxID=158383 RepID=A0A8S0S4D1_OLEEU|nr:Hypothetical predicted protein [Olea europaea subsp. europaea]
MGVVVEYMQKIWPFSTFKVNNDLRASDGIVKKLPVPESTKQFIYAIRDPESQSSIYILSVQNLSERSASDAECLIRGVKPDAVVVHMGSLNDSDIRVSETSENGDSIDEYAVPTSSFEVLKRCFVHKTNSEKYEKVAGSLFLKEVFGVSFNAHVMAAKKAAEEVSSSFLTLELPFVKCITDGDSECGLDTGVGQVVESGNGFLGAFGFQLSNLARKRNLVSERSRGFYVTNGVQSQMVKLLSTYLVQSSNILKLSSEDVRPLVDYEAPQFAKSVYPLLTDLHDIFVDIPSMGRALACAQKLLSDVNKGEIVDSQLLSEFYLFRVAIEGLRIALNNAARLPLSKIGDPILANSKFCDLPVEDQSHAILAQALHNQTKKFKSIVAVVDASALAGLRKHWKTPVPPEVKSTVEELITNCEDNGEIPHQSNMKRLLADKPVVAVGAGATAVFGVSSLYKVIPASTFVKIATFHVPTSLKLLLTQTQKIVLALGKGLGLTKGVAPGMGSTALKSSTLKAAVSAEKIRTISHSVIASAEKTSLSAMRTAFYEIMRKRRVRPIGVLPWATFGCSIATCTGLLVYGDGIECVAETFPVAPSVASLGRGIKSLHQAAEAVRQAESSKLQRSIESLLNRFKNVKIQ